MLLSLFIPAPPPVTVKVLPARFSVLTLEVKASPGHRGRPAAAVVNDVKGQKPVAVLRFRGSVLTLALEVKDSRCHKSPEPRSRRRRGQAWNLSHSAGSHAPWPRHLQRNP